MEDRTGTIGENLQYFQEHHSEIYQAYEQFGRLVHNQGGPLDEKTRWLVKVAVTTAGRNPLALKTHIQKALKHGCTRQEIEHAMLLSAPSVGFPTMMEGLLVLRQTVAESSKD